ncbi:hypothetical protein ACFQE5_05135 [Pseudonocardia hispaniensis]|uniref:Pyrroloquinoline-quinone binding quinoprotein n=1 Tax=Pseudonocardia hispaniensis TaxID=904933 RepID=A0ABW1IYK4_9PSEU
MITVLCLLRPVRVLAVGIAMAATLTACSASNPVDQPGRSSAQVPAFDPPVAFGPTAAVLSPRNGPLPIVQLLDGQVGWAAAPDGLTRVDLASATVGSSAAPTGEGLRQGQVSVGAPVMAGVGDRRLAIAAFPVVLTEAGAAARQPAAELVAADAASGERLFTLTIPFAEWAPASWTDTTVVGVGNNPARAVVTVRGVADSGALQQASFGVDLGRREILWNAPGLAIDAVVGDVAVGTVTEGTATTVRAVGIADGATRWTDPDGGPVYQAGEGLVAVSGKIFHFLTTAEGRRVEYVERTRLALDETVRFTCHYDERATTVCSRPTAAGGQYVVAFDSTSASPLWRSPGGPGDRSPSTITAVWHGALYGTTPNGPVVLDARTGAERNSAPGVAPLLVSAYYGIGSGLRAGSGAGDAFQSVMHAHAATG